MRLLNKTPRSLFISLLIALSPIYIEAEESQNHQTAAAIIEPMRFMDEEQTQRAIDLTANYLRELDTLYQQRNAALEKTGESSDDDPEVGEQIADAWVKHRRFAIALRDSFVVQLNAIMAPGRVDRIKDGLTADWYHRELQRFDRLAPDITYPEHAHIVSLLIEMRENAMLEIDPKLQRQWAHKYRGIINNFIAAQGYDFHALSRAFVEKYGESD